LDRQSFNPGPDFIGRFVGKSDAQYLVGPGDPGFKEMSDPKSQGARLAGSRSGYHHERSAPVPDRLLLGRC
jgi:hypothetical protein